jgi:hypothetical protein
MKRPSPIRDERGTTMVEVLVSLSTGLIVLVALTTVILVVLNGNARVSARVDATQRARITLSKIMQELHSACVEPRVPPILTESTGTSLIFMHSVSAEGGEVAPKPIRSVIELKEGALTQTDYEATSEAQPWVFSEEPMGPSEELMSNISPTPPSSSIFRYYAYGVGAISATPLNEPLDKTTAGDTILVEVAFDAAPSRAQAGDEGATASIRESAALRLTPPSFSEQVEALPCQ